MVELKTLKDLTPFTEFEHSRGKIFLTDKLVSYTELRQEAVKWVKELMKHNYNLLDYGSFVGFFNLTSEDLK